MKMSGFKILECEKVYKNVMVVENTWKVIFNNRDIRRQEFGLAYNEIPLNHRQQFVSDFARKFELKRIETNSQHCMILAEKI